MLQIGRIKDGWALIDDATATVISFNDDATIVSDNCSRIWQNNGMPNQVIWLGDFKDAVQYAVSADHALAWKITNNEDGSCAVEFKDGEEFLFINSDYDASTKAFELVTCWDYLNRYGNGDVYFPDVADALKKAGFFVSDMFHNDETYEETWTVMTLDTKKKSHYGEHVCFCYTLEAAQREVSENEDAHSSFEFEEVLSFDYDSYTYEPEKAIVVYYK